MKSRSALLLACLGVCILRASLAQTAPPAPTTTLKTQSTLVLVPALVRDKAGKLVFALQANDFVLTDNGVPQPLSLEPDADSEPLALVVVLEKGAAGGREYDRLGALAPMIESVVGAVPHRVAVVAFDSRPTLFRDFTSSGDAIAKAILDLTPDCTRQHHMEDCIAPGSVHNLSLGDNGAAILDALGFSVDLLRSQPAGYRRAILLVSETLDRGSHLTLDQALRAISDTNTAIYSIAFSTGRSEAAHYAFRQLPTQPGRAMLENHHPNPPTGCMGKDPDPDPDATTNRAVQAYDCLAQLAPPLTLAKMAAIVATDSLRRNIPETVARLTGGEYFRMTDAKSLERSLAAISNHIPNRYLLSFQPPSPSPGLHVLDLRLRDLSGLKVTARSSYWSDWASTPPKQP